MNRKRVSAWFAMGTFCLASVAGRSVFADAESYRAAVQNTDGLVDYYDYEDGFGDSNDGGNGFNDPATVEGDPTAPDLSPGVADEGLAAVFDGVGDQLPVVRSIQDDFTIMAWVRPDIVPQAGASGDQYWSGTGLIYADVPGGANDYGTAITGDVLAFGIGNPDQTTHATTLLVEGEWVHFAAVRAITDAGSNLRVYVNGILEGELDHANAAPLDATGTLTIGGNAIDGRFFTGGIDELALFGVALAEGDIAELYESFGGTIPECPTAGDTHATDLVITPPLAGDVGIYTVDATAVDDSGDSIRYTFMADNGTVQLKVGPQPGASAQFNLFPGTWTISVSVDDSARCDDVAGDATRASSPIVIDVPPSELISHWTFNATLEDEIADNIGTFNGDVEPNYVTGYDGTPESAIRFDGIDDHIQVNRTIQNDFTIALWIRTSVQQVNLGAQYWQGSGLVYADVPGGANDFGTSVNGDLFGFGIGNPDTTVLSLSPVIEARWVHVTAVRQIDANAGNVRLRIYVDGFRNGEVIHANTAPLDASATITIGGNALDNHLFTGDIDEVRLYNYVLSDAEIAALAEGAVNPVCPTQGDTHCNGFTVTGPDGGGSGSYAVEAAGTDDSGEEVLYTFTAVSGFTSLRAGPQPEPIANFNLTVGTWDITVTADDDIGCDDKANDAVCTQSYEVEPAEPALVGHWTFDATLEDEVGDNIGTFLGDVEPLYVEGFDGKSEGAIRFDGIDDYVQVNRVIQEDFTISIWLRADVPQPTTGADQYWQGTGLVYADVPGGANDFGLSVLGEIPGFGIGNPDQTVLGTTSVTNGDWIHLAVTRGVDTESGVSRLEIYIDGNFDGSIDNPNLAALDATAMIAIGANSVDARYFSGDLDDVRLYNYVLTPEEIAELAQGTTTGGGFVRGDADASGAINITDGIFILNFLFLGGATPICRDAADADDSGSTNITDGIFVLNFLFLGGDDPFAPYPACGADPTADEQSCEAAHPSCV
jgi:hypothetical protein